jgi:iron complex outermembrane receptor protein
LGQRVVFLATSVVAMVCVPAVAMAQGVPPEAAPSAELVLPTIEVVAPTPLLGSGVERDKVPAENTVVTRTDISRDGNANAMRALNETAAGLTLDDTAGNPYQPTLIYHGFQASPLQGNAQGLAVYVNGARFNQPFGDTVNWDLFPDIAIDRVNVEGSNPVFGLNALGGAVAVQMKNGFTYHGGELDLLGGSFGKYQAELQYGVQAGNVATYIAARGVHDDGWRQAQSSDLINFFGDLGWRGGRGELHIDLTSADTRLNGPGTSPVQQLAADPAAVFTAPNLIVNTYRRINLTTNVIASDSTSVQGNLYYDYLLQRVANGGVSNFAPCGDGSGLLCESPGVFATSVNGNPIPDFLNGGPYGQLNSQSTNTNGYGAALQVTNRSRLLGRGNQFIAGLSFDGAQTLFSANSQLGQLIVANSQYAGPGMAIAQPDGSIAPVRVAISDANYGAFFTDLYDLTPSLSVNLAGRFNLAQIDLQDQLGTALSGNHTYTRFNPSAGLTWKVLPDLSLYASYSEANRAPTPAELTCASPASPCSLANFFVGDPDLRQVVSHTVEAGVRARVHPFADATLTSDLSLFRTTLSDDILAVNSPLQGRVFFQNVGGTLRQGADLALRLTYGRLQAWLAYSYIDAEFQTDFTESSQNNPGADDNGNIQVKSGDRLPGVPQHILKVGADYKPTDAWTIGATAIAASGEFLFGDEANLTPRTPAYFVLNLHTSYQLTKNLQLFGLLENAFNTQYYTFGTLSPTSSVPIAQAPGATNPRSYSPAAPIGALVGVRATF